MSRYVLKCELKGDYIGFDGSKGRLADIVNASREAYKVYNEYEEELRMTLLFNKIYSDDDANTIFCSITRDLFWANDDRELKYNLELSLYDIDNNETIDRWEDFLTYQVLQEFVKESDGNCKDYNLLQDTYDNIKP